MKAHGDDSRSAAAPELRITVSTDGEICLHACAAGAAMVSALTRLAPEFTFLTAHSDTPRGAQLAAYIRHAIQGDQFIGNEAVEMAVEHAVLATRLGVDEADRERE